MGYSRYYTTSVWVGCDIPKSVEGLKGASYPSAIWKNYMTYAHEGLTPLEFLPYAQLSEEFIEEYYPIESESEELSSEGIDNMSSEDIEIVVPEQGDVPFESEETIPSEEAELPSESEGIIPSEEAELPSESEGTTSSEEE